MISLATLISALGVRAPPWALVRAPPYDQLRSSLSIGSVRIRFPVAAKMALQRAEVEIETCEVLKAAGIEPTGDAPVCHYSSGVDVVSFGVEELGA